jgi:hypothetical protein
MRDLKQIMIRSCVQSLQVGYQNIYGSLNPDYLNLLTWAATLTLDAIASSDALFHDLEHTILVTQVGQEILHGKQLREGNVTSEDWLHFMISLLCHDVGYVRGICQQDCGATQTFATGIENGVITLAPGATDASLTAYHIDRSKLFVQEHFASHPRINVTTIQQNIELTRFPIPCQAIYQETGSAAGLVRAADLIGQLSDPCYLEKLPALFYEFEEIGTNRNLGYRHPGDLRADYPRFFRQVVSPYLRDGIYYLSMTSSGRNTLATLYGHVVKVERELTGEDSPSDRGSRIAHFNGDRDMLGDLCCSALAAASLRHGSEFAPS